MDYLQIVNLIFFILFGVMSLLFVHFIFFAIVGIFCKKKYPKTEEKRKYGIVVSARNEEKVIGNLIASIRKTSYPQDKLHIFVVAHNCTDNTAKFAREAGATVYEYNNENECTKGYAFRYLFEQIQKEYGIQSFDGFFQFDADNVVANNYFDKMNDAFVAGEGKNVITSFRNSKNFSSNTLSAMYGLYFIYGCRFESRGRTALGCSTRVQGTGFVIPSEFIKDGWNYVTLTEDWEFVVDQILRGNKVCFCDEAVFYDEQPTTLHVMWRQRVRWAKGHLLVCSTRLKDLIKTLFRSKKKQPDLHRMSVFDATTNILPICIIGTALSLLNLVALLLAPLFGNYNLLQILTDYLWNLLRGLGISYLMLVLASVAIYLLEGRRIKINKPHIIVTSILLWPFFLFVSTPAEIVALFHKNLKWKPIPHDDSTDIETIHASESLSNKSLLSVDVDDELEA